MPFSHLRDPSEENLSSPQDGSYPLILEHILSYPGQYNELPLRSMYTLNSTPRAQPSLSRPGTPTATSPIHANFPADVKANVAAQFQSSLVSQITNLPSQPCSLPPVFINSFLRRCFPPELELVDFPQALTALDYMKDLETRRRREVAAALERVGVDRTSVQADTVAKKHAGVAAWVKQIESNERKIEALYTQLYIGLRRWVLVNELSLTPFDKHNCIAMLNTLYPPVNPNTTTQPTSMLTPAVLKTQRSGFFDWIRHVEHRGSSTLEPLMRQGRRANSSDANGWPAVRDCLDNYLRVTMHVIDECQSIQGIDDFNRQGRKLSSDGRESRSSRKADSGVSFSSSDNQANGRKRNSSSASNSTTKTSPIPPPFGQPNATKSTTTLEKLARELRKLKGSRAPPSPSSPHPGTPNDPSGSFPGQPPPDSHSRQASNASSMSSNGSNKENIYRRSSVAISTRTAPRSHSKNSPSDETEDQDGRRSRSRAGSRAGNAILRSFSRARDRSRSRSRHRHAEKERSKTPLPDDVPPTPPIPKSAFEDDYDDERPASRASRFRRSMSLSRGYSGNPSKAVKKMRSSGDVGNKGDGIGVHGANGMQVTGGRSTDTGLIGGFGGGPGPGMQGMEFFDKDEMVKQRDLWEARERERVMHEASGRGGMVRDISVGKAL